MFETSVNDQFNFKIEESGNSVLVDGKPVPAEIRRVNAHSFHVLYNGLSTSVLVNKVDTEEKEVTLTVNGKKARVKLTTELDLLLKRLGMAGAGAKKAGALKAPMPGMIYSLRAAEGDAVKKGDPVLILEAMKMENVIKAPADATVAKIHVKPGMSVEKGQLLVTFS